MAFTEVKAPEQFKFDKPGDKLEGVLLSIMNQTVKGKTAIQYTVERHDGGKATFLATWDLMQKIDRSMLGCPIAVKFDRLHKTIEKNGNRAKMFTVMVDRDAPRADHAGVRDISDEDIPF